MQNLRIPYVQDVARLTRPTVEETIVELIKHYQGSPVFNYQTVCKICRPLFSGNLTLNAAIQACMTRGSPLGRKFNADVAAYVWESSQDRNTMCFDVSPRDYAIRSDIRIGVAPLFYFVENGKVYFYWLQPRRGHNLNKEQLGVLGSIIKSTFIVDDFEQADIEILDLSAPPGSRERTVQIHTLSNLPILAPDALEAKLSIFAQAYDAVCKMEIKQPERPQKKPDDRQPGLFGD